MESLEYLKEDCAQDFPDTTRNKRLQTDMEVANLLWGILSADHDLMNSLRYLVRTGSSHLAELCLCGSLKKDKVEHFLKTITVGLEVWEKPAEPRYSELLSLRTKENDWWSLEKSGAFFRLYFEFHKYFARHFRINSDDFEGCELAELRKGKPDFYLTPEDYFVSFYNKSERYRTILSESQEPFNPYDKNRYKLRRISHNSPPRFLRNFLLHHTEGALTRFRMENDSVTAKMNRLYGLPDGSDISGTFVNNSWVLRVLSQPDLSGFSRLNLTLPGMTEKGAETVPPLHDGLLHLVLLTSLVGQYHHTFNEAALVLGLKEIAPYTIGDYSSVVSEQDSGEFKFLRDMVKKAMNQKEFIMEPGFFAKNKGAVCRYSFPDGPDKKNFAVWRFLKVTPDNYCFFPDLPEDFLSVEEMKIFLTQICESNEK